MLFYRVKDKDLQTYSKVAIKDVKEFNCTIQNPKIEVYRYVINFIG